MTASKYCFLLTAALLGFSGVRVAVRLVSVPTARHSRTMSIFRSLKARAKTIADAVPALPTMAEYVSFRARHRPLKAARPEADADILALLEDDGYAVLPSYFSSERCALAVEELEGLLRTRPDHVRQAEDLRIHGAEELSQTAASFHSDARLQRISDRYSRVKTGNVFTLASRVTPDIWTTPANSGWHRDSRFRQFKAFLYLNEVTLENGPLQVVRGSHKISQHLRDVQVGGLAYTNNLFRHEQIEKVVAHDPSRLVSMTGGPGTLILADTGMLHRGSPPRSGVRYAFTNYYLERDQILGAIKTFRPVNSSKLHDMVARW